MKKISIGIIALSTILFFNACNSNKPKEDTKVETAVTYACPMHSEVTGGKDDKCSKCGMALEALDPSKIENEYFMQFKTTPEKVEENKEVSLSFTPKIKTKDAEQVALDIEHEKKIHLIVVNKDLSYFDHIHPEFNADGSYVVPTKFPAGGEYTLFADYKPTGGNHTVDKIAVNVSGKTIAAKSWGADKISNSSGNFSVSLNPLGNNWITGTAVHVLGTLKKDGKEIDANSLENYLGAKAHMVMISLGDQEYMHIHPGIDKGKLHLHAVFKKPGVYRAWVQFNGDGKLHTIDLVINVKEGSAADIKAVNQAAIDYHSN